MLAAETPTVLNEGDTIEVLVVPPLPCSSLLLKINCDPSGVVCVSAPLVPELYPLDRMVHAALAGVPPVELLFNVQPPALPLKLLEMSVALVPELEVALEVRFMVCPEQMLLEEALAVTAVGTGLMVTKAVSDMDNPPAAVTVRV